MATITHTHRCVICDAPIPCDSPDAPQDCLVSALTCSSCEDISQDWDGGDAFTPQVNGVGVDYFQDICPSQGDEANVSQAHDSVDNLRICYRTGLVSDTEAMTAGDEEWVPDLQTRPERPSQPPVRTTARRKKGRGQR